MQLRKSLVAIAGGSLLILLTAILWPQMSALLALIGITALIILLLSLLAMVPQIAGEAYNQLLKYFKVWSAKARNRRKLEKLMKEGGDS